MFFTFATLVSFIHFFTMSFNRLERKMSRNNAIHVLLFRPSNSGPRDIFNSRKAPENIHPVVQLLIGFKAAMWSQGSLPMGL